MPAPRASAQPIDGPQGAIDRLRRGPPPPAVAAVGDEPFLQEEVARSVAQAWTGGVVPVDGEDPQAPGPGLLDEGDLFAERRVVDVRRADGWARRHAAAIAAWLDAPSPSSRLVLRLEDLDGRTSLARRLQAAGWVVPCRRPWASPPPWKGLPPWDHDLGAWIRARAKGTYGKRMSGPAAHLLAARAGESLGVLDGALSTLALYAGGRDALEEADIEALVGDAATGPVARIGDALLRGDPPGARRALGILLERGLADRDGRVETGETAAATVLVADLARLLSAGLRARDGAAAATGPGAARIPMRVREAARIPPAAVAGALAALSRADAALKSGAREPATVCWRLVEEVGRALRTPASPVKPR